MSRDPQTPPQAAEPRLVTPRMLLASLLAGFALSVVGVPVFAVVAGSVPESWHRVRVNDALHVEGHVVFSKRTELVVATVWFTTSEPLVQSATTLRLAWMEDARDATGDARPRRVRTALDGRHRSRSEWRVGWPWRAAYGQTRQRMGPDHTVESRGLWVGSLYGRAVSVPYLPMWPGLLGNTFVLAAVLLAVRMVSRLRSRQGRGPS